MPARSSPDEDAAYLTRLGARARERREALGLTRRQLAANSGLSERYLAQLELGRGNVSILLIRRLAAALDLAAEQLVADAGSGRSTADILGVLRFLDEDRLAQAARLVAERYGPASRSRRERVALVGLRGAGKSTIGAALARRRGVRFHELDQEIERDVGLSLAEVFSIYGQDAYHAAERRLLEVFTGRGPCVIATGGSLVVEQGTYDLLRARCFTVWLRAEPEDHMNRVIAQGDVRPIRGRRHAMVELRTILAQRERLYAMADVVVDTSRNAEDACVAQIEAAIGAPG